MKKLFAILAIAGIMVSCGNKKKADKKTETDTTVTTNNNTNNNGTTTTTVSGVPAFSDPEVQQFANDYAAFIIEYKNGMKDPAKMEALSNNLQQWQDRSQAIGMKLATNPGEAQKWAAWMMVIMKEIMPTNMTIPEMK